MKASSFSGLEVYGYLSLTPLVAAVVVMVEVVTVRAWATYASQRPSPVLP
jgi:hypothetical protein